MLKDRAVVTVGAVALTGIEGTRVDVETALSSQLPGIRLIGLPDVALGEAKQRIRLAAQSSGFRLASRMIVINLSPAALPKQGSSFDLAIALGAIAASGCVNRSKLPTVAHIGELGLDGTLRRPQGLFTAVLAARECGYQMVMVPEISVCEAMLVPHICVIGVGNLREAVEWHDRGAHNNLRDSGESDRKKVQVIDRFPMKNHSTLGSIDANDPSKNAGHKPDMADVIGQEEAVEAFVVAAAGRHHISITGPPGSGKSMLASRLSTILPELSEAEAVKVTRIAALGDKRIEKLQTQPPFENPHHTSSLVSIIGGVTGASIQPGAVTRASHGVLFLDEAPEFAGHILESLREPLETRCIQIQRSRVQATLPAEFQLVIASNPCPCGYSDKNGLAQNCDCGPAVKLRYSRRISGPLRDRLDLRCDVNRVSQIRTATSYPESKVTSEIMRNRVSEARRCSEERLENTPWKVNAEVPGVYLRTSRFKLSRGVTTVLDRALSRGSITLRGYDRVLRIAWTVADLNGHITPMREDVASALTLRGDFL